MSITVTIALTSFLTSVDETLPTCESSTSHPVWKSKMRFETHTISDNLLKKGEVEMGRSLKKMMTIGSYLFFAVFYPNAYADICHSSLYSHSSYNF